MTEFTILGAGISGLTVATALAQAGREVRVIERAPEISEVGAGIQVSPNGARVLGALGVCTELWNSGIEARAVEVVNGETGGKLARVAVSGGYHFLHRAKLIETLHRAAVAAGVQIELGKSVTDIGEDGGGFSIAYGDGARETVETLLAADGVHSVARRFIAPKVSPRFTGYVAWRALVQGGPFDDPVAQVHTGAGRHLVRYPLDARTLNIVGVEKRKDWVADGWNHVDDPANFRAAFQEFSPAIRADLAGLETVNLWGLFRYPVLRRWWKGSLCLLGDAAHPTLPTLAQGANMGLEDGYALAHLLCKYPQRRTAFAAFEAMRKPRVEAVIDASGTMAENYHLTGAKRAAAHAALRIGSRVAPSLIARRTRWIYDYDVTRETF